MQIGRNFVGAINNMSDEDVAGLTATLEVITLKRAMESCTLDKIPEKTPFVDIRRLLKLSPEKKDMVDEINRHAGEIKRGNDYLNLRWGLVEKIAKKAGYKKSVGMDEDEVEELVCRCLTDIAIDYKLEPRNFTREELVEHVMEKLFDELGKEAQKVIKNMSPDEEEKILRKIKEEIYSLPEEKRARILKDLNMNELSAESLWKMFKSGALTGGTLMGAKACGFGLYLAATTIIHAIFTTILGITLPFWFYTFLTSTIALILNPVTAPLLIAGIGFGIYKNQEKKFNRKVLAICLFQIYVNSMA